MPLFTLVLLSLMMIENMMAVSSQAYSLSSIDAMIMKLWSVSV